jgi:hypothetical protein
MKRHDLTDYFIDLRIQWTLLMILWDFENALLVLMSDFTFNANDDDDEKLEFLFLSLWMTLSYSLLSGSERLLWPKRHHKLTHDYDRSFLSLLCRCCWINITLGRRSIYSGSDMRKSRESFTSLWRKSYFPFDFFFQLNSKSFELKGLRLFKWFPVHSRKRREIWEQKVRAERKTRVQEQMKRITRPRLFSEVLKLLSLTSQWADWKISYFSTLLIFSLSYHHSHSSDRNRNSLSQHFRLEDEYSRILNIRDRTSRKANNAGGNRVTLSLLQESKSCEDCMDLVLVTKGLTWRDWVSRKLQ